ncbi:adenosylcobinamide-phosphate synthase CbiB [Xanthobacter sp. TB0136]|uniref:adenosylcobinamide-phosphate synthase CbiB n=1 Tax=Xanthobacter sp. TB0136 TaxID=3459177 RepID=UPI004039E926
MGFGITAVALLVEAVFGYPDALVRRIGHPVMWIGALISRLERAWNKPHFSPEKRRALGVVTVIILVLAAALPMLVLQSLLGLVPLGAVVAGVLGSALIAQRSLHWHVAQVAQALETGDIEIAREAVSHIVGRDPQQLDSSGIARAAIETLAENFSDGIVAPTFWMCLLGLPGAAAYKALNTADSMIGHLNVRYGDFGWAAARADDVVNLPASRIAGWLLVGAAALGGGGSPHMAYDTMRRDARKHRSPNAGWPEAAMAGALHLRLNGPKIYDGVPTDDAYMGQGRREATAADVRAALRLYRRADALMVALVLLVAGVMTLLSAAMAA